ncbi:proline iminopeptidase [Actinorhabdospora filicis]|uniref:Proline iminopeptidase n=1 Tax=Actinorhabdospora filicis TaxID=1785913 RepID=A0A9W6SNH1_9ACTN|nr:alpha/beta hydrolase [Actinorhabdospora filicis]GLZ79107.1 proline iminopeptidase [Actinorhabdospora filicis]
MTLISVNGTRLYVDARGPEDGVPVVFVHGGPGMSCHPFMSAQGDALASRGLRIIGVDQRGLFRSDELPADAEITIEAIIGDFEALREALGLDGWGVIGHSFGGWLATHYAVAHPGRVRSVLFDSPGWDQDIAGRHRLAIIAEILDGRGDEEGATRARRLMMKPERLALADDVHGQIAALGEDAWRMTFATREASDAFDAAQAEVPEDAWRWERHLHLRARSFEPALPLLEKLTMPTMLLHGRHDPVVPPAAVGAYRAAVAEPRAVRLDGSAHLPFAEEPEAYTEAVAAFFTKGA